MNCRSWIILFWVGFCVPGVCQDIPEFGNFMACYELPANHSENSFGDFLKTFDRAGQKNDHAFLRHLFHSIQSNYFRHYKASANFPELFATGDFDCLSGTALMSVALTAFHFNYSIIETNYHIFIIVHTSKGDVLVESTDRHFGLVCSEEDIARRIEGYKENRVANSHKNIYRYHFSLYHEIEPDQLRALFYLNQAVAFFNEGNWKKCAELLEKSGKIYSSPRVHEIAALLIRAVSASESDPEVIRDISLRLRPWSEPTLAGI